MEIMTAIYIACLLFGGVLLGVSIVFGGEHGDSDHTAELGEDVDLSHDLDAHGDVDIETVDSPDMDIHSEIDLDSGSDIDSQAVSSFDKELSINAHTAEVVQFFSIRYVIYFMAFFGLTGSLLSLFSVASISTLISSSFVGSFSYYFGYRLMKYLKTSESGKAVQLLDMKGRYARVNLKVSKIKYGKIFIKTENSSFQIIAKLSESSKKDFLNPGTEVLIIDFDDSIAIVVEKDF